MATSSFPFDNQDTTEAQYSQLFRELQTSGVADTYGGTGLRVDATGGMGLSVQPGFAIVRGHGFQSTGTEVVTLPAATTSTVIHLVVLRLDPAANTISIQRLSGVGNGGAPALTQTDTGIYEIPLMQIEVGPSAANIDPTKMTDKRAFLGAAPTGWSTASRPTSPRYATLGYNATTGQWEFYNGVEWKWVVDPSLGDRVAALETEPYIRRSNAISMLNGTSTIQNQETTELDWTVSQGGSGMTYDPFTGRFTSSKPGTFAYDITIHFNDSGGAGIGRRHLSLLRGTTLIDTDIRGPVDSSYTSLRLSGEVTLAAGQYLVTNCYIYAGGFLALVSSPGYQKLSIRRVGP